jgi:hypothetical protein
MKADFPALWAESPSTLRREPTNAELAGGFPCGDLDLQLFNELFFRLSETQREIVYAIIQSGQTPNANNNTQLWQAMRVAQPPSALIHSGMDTGATNAIVANVSPDITDYAQGYLYVIKVANAPTGAATANLDGRGVRTITRADGTPIRAGDWGIGEMIALLDDGTNLRLQGIKSSFSPARNLTSFISGGVFSFTVPAGIYWIFAELVGAGGGGSGGQGGVTWSSGGGGSGGYASGWIAVVPGQVISLVVGFGGNGASNGNGAVGGVGGTTSIGSFMQATGGNGGTGGTTVTGGGAPGQGTGGQKNLYGSAGGDGNLYTATVQGGQGGASAFGGGGRTSTLDNGFTTGVAPGSGGGGIWGTGVGAQPGGRGADGGIFIQY